jgi:hypothetical protein
MTPLNEKRLIKVLDKVDHRYRWYCSKYPSKASAQPIEASKRWWETLVRACSQFDFSAQDVLDTLAQDIKMEERISAYAHRAKTRWGYTI